MADPTEFGERAISAAQNFIKRGQEVAKRETRVIKLQSQVSKLRSQRQRMFYEMGYKVFSLFERDLVKNQDLRIMCQQIRGVDAEIEVRREEIEQLRRAEGRNEGGIDDDPGSGPPPDDGILEDDEIIRE